MEKLTLEFEKELNILAVKIEEMKKFSVEKNIDLSDEMEKLKKELNNKLSKVYKKLTPWEKVSVARHPKRPYTLDYLKYMSEDFVELHGDRLFKDDPAIVGGICKISGQNFVVIGHQKGRDIEENIYRNFGMPNPDGYRKALRLFKLAERFKMPVLTLIDTAGAYPGLEAEERGQGEAIARNLLELAGLKTEVIAVIIGEGGSGGALALGVADRVLMLENSTYSVISPEGCAAILFKDASKAPEAAEKLKIDADSLKELKIIDGIIKEPVGGAHQDHILTAKFLKDAVLKEVAILKKHNLETLLDNRYKRFRKFGDLS